MNDPDVHARALLGRARTVLRAAPEPGWQAIEDSVIAAVRSTPRAGWALDVEDPAPGTASGTIRVSDIALTTHLSRALRDDPDFIVTDIDVQSDGTALQAISINISGRYRADLRVAAERALALCHAVVADVIGESSRPSVDIVVNDVHQHRHLH